MVDNRQVPPTVSRWYWRLRLAHTRWRHRAQIDGVEAVFRTTTRHEQQRAKSFLGEEHVLEAMIGSLTGDEVVWDIGATVGTYACFVARNATRGQVVGIEPEPSNFAQLAANLGRNAPPARWMVSNVALSDEDGESRLVRTEDNVGSGHHYLEKGSDGLPVTTRRGDTLAGGGFPEPDVLKIDVQGAELQVLEGLSGVLDRVDRIYLELHTEKCRRYGTTTEEVEAYLQKNGFVIDQLGEPSWDRSGVYHVCADRH